MEKSIDTVFLLGAGASAPLGLPITKGFLSDFKPSNNQLIELLNVIMEYLGVDDIEDLDIEKVFSILSEIEGLKDSLIGYYLSSKPHGGNIIQSNFISSATHAINSFSLVGEKLFIELKKFILNKLSNFSHKKAFDLYYSLFDDYDFNLKPLILFTTNYDLILEEAFSPKSSDIHPAWIEKGVKDIYLGFKLKSILPVFEFEIDRIYQPNTVSILKLHGSINWRPYEDLIILGDKNPPNDPDVPFLIYPGYKGVADEEPYFSLHFALLDVLPKVKNLVTIGFAFRDSYINTIIRHALSMNKDLKLYVIAPYFPSDSYFPFLQEAFGERVVHHRLKVVLDDDKAFLKNDEEIVENLFDLIES